ncbi:DUF4062 domain-containing protein [Tenacibaculum dicentrarchi]|nr:DUF4062 domain-containing protein [Tenacibaculum dicentrarchi]
MNKRYQVFISSTYADLKEERAKVIQTIMELDCIPAGMEIFPAIDEEQFEFIKKVIDDCDYYLLIIGGRYGSLSEEGISYTEMEYDYAISKGIKIIAFVHSKPEEIPLGKSEKDSDLRQKLQEFRNKVSTNRLIKFWSNPNELPGLVALSLSKTIKTYPAIGWIRANTSVDPELYKEMNELRKENQGLKLNSNIEAESNPLSFEDLASMEDSINIYGTHTRWDNTYKQDVKKDWEKEITWNQIFSVLSPYLLEHPSDGETKKIVSRVIYETVENHSTNGMAHINDQDFQTIKIQLKSLGLTDVKYTKTTQGNMGLFWYLTEKGDKLMLKLRSIKK